MFLKTESPNLVTAVSKSQKLFFPLSSHSSDITAQDKAF